MSLSNNAYVCFVAGKSNSTLLVTRHAARVEEASPEEDPSTHLSACTKLQKSFTEMVHTSCRN
jgi:hypothetical protein